MGKGSGERQAFFAAGGFSGAFLGSTARLMLKPTELNSRMKIQVQKHLEEAKVGWVLLWLIGVPLPVLLILFLLRGCT